MTEKKGNSYIKLFELLRIRSLHHQVLDYEELDILIYLWRRLLQFKISDGNFEEIYLFLALTVSVFRLIPRSKFDWKPPQKDKEPSSYNHNQQNQYSFHQVLNNWLKCVNKPLDAYSGNTPSVSTGLSAQYYSSLQQFIQRFKYERERKLNPKYKEILVVQILTSVNIKNIKERNVHNVGNHLISMHYIHQLDVVHVH